MRNSLRTFVVVLMISALTVNPAVACHYCGGYWGGYYGCGGCGGCEVVVHDDCGCGACGSCDGIVVEGDGAKAAPTEVPPQQPATVDRPVDDGPAPTLPAQPEPETRPVPPADDLFNGTEAATPPTTTVPPVVPPATEEPADETPVTPPTETPAEDDLFGGTAGETTPPADAAPPTEIPTETPATDSTDELFGPTEGAETTPTETNEMPAEETPAEEETPAAEDDDIFGASGRVLREKGGLASAEMRLWVDNTGTYSCYGRLVKFMDGHVRLLKDNGRTTTVPLYRLSPSDLNFVNRQARAQKAERFQTAQASTTILRATN
jgi:hypothetical protein